MGGLNRQLELRGQAKERRRQLEAESYAQTGRLPRTSFMPSLPPEWDAWFQALENEGVTRLGDQSVGEAKGVFPGRAPLVSNFDPSYQSSAVLESRPSKQIGARNDYMIPSLGGLVTAMGEDGRWTASQPRPQGRVSATGQSKLRVQGQRGGSKR